MILLEIDCNFITGKRYLIFEGHLALDL